MVWRILLFVWIAVAMGVSLLMAPLVVGLEETTRVLYFHIPCAWLTVVALGWATVQSILYLWKRDLRHDDHANAAAELGLIFCIAATLTGALWARAKWGLWWNWDPRETSFFYTLLLYAAYLALRASIEGEEKRARLSAVYSAGVFPLVLFLVFVAPRLLVMMYGDTATLHPDLLTQQAGGTKVNMGPFNWWCFMAMLVGFTGLYTWLQSLRVRVARLERRRELARG